MVISVTNRLVLLSEKIGYSMNILGIKPIDSINARTLLMTGVTSATEPQYKVLIYFSQVTYNPVIGSSCIMYLDKKELDGDHKEAAPYSCFPCHSLTTMSPQPILLTS